MKSKMLPIKGTMLPIKSKMLPIKSRMLPIKRLQYFNSTYAHLWQHLLRIYSYVNGLPQDDLQGPKHTNRAQSESF